MADLYYVTLVADANTPAEHIDKAGTKLAFNPAVTSVETIRQSAELYGIAGNAVRAPDGTWTWLMGATTDPLLRAINNLTPWKDTERRRVWRSAFRDLRELGVSSPALITMAQALWAAAAAEITAPTS
jgi:hypothetical protein